MILNRRTAQILQDDLKSRRIIVLWFVFKGDGDGLIARPHTADHEGGRFLYHYLAADTLAELHAMMPKGLTIYPPEPFEMPFVVKSWG